MNLTHELADQVMKTSSRPLNEPVEKMARASLLNVLGTAIGASAEPAVCAVVQVGRDHGGHPSIPIPGRTERLDRLRAATAIGLAAHLDDYDDTHLATVIHPGAAALAAAWTTGVPSGACLGQLLTAFAVGCEVQLRVGLAMSPWHYDQGWHITGTCAPLGAAATAALLSGCSASAIRDAIGLGADMALGHREGFGSMIKPFHPGKGAANGVLAAALAAGGFSVAGDPLGDPGAFYEVLSPHYEPDRLLADWGTRWELLDNTFKPYPCGIVCHPAIDAAIALSDQLLGRLDEVARIDILCHPLVVELTGDPDPHTGLQARFSTIHGVAAGLADGRAGLAQYSDGRVTQPDLVSLRSRTRLQVDPGRARASAAVQVSLHDGTVLSKDVRQARGSLERPLTGEELQEKVTALIEPVLPGRSAAIIECVLHQALAEDLRQLSGLLHADPGTPRSTPLNAVAS